MIFNILKFTIFFCFMFLVEPTKAFGMTKYEEVMNQYNFTNGSIDLELIPRCQELDEHCIYEVFKYVKCFYVQEHEPDKLANYFVFKSVKNGKPLFRHTIHWGPGSTFLVDGEPQYSVNEMTTNFSERVRVLGAGDSYNLSEITTTYRTTKTGEVFFKFHSDTTWVFPSNPGQNWQIAAYDGVGYCQIAQ